MQSHLQEVVWSFSAVWEVTQSPMSSGEGLLVVEICLWGEFIYWMIEVFVWRLSSLRMKANTAVKLIMLLELSPLQPH